MWRRRRRFLDDDSPPAARTYGPSVHQEEVPGDEMTEQRKMGRGILAAIDAVLSQGRGVGPFAIERAIESGLPNPGIFISGYGFLGLPVHSSAVAAMKRAKVLTDAPFGDKDKTLKVDKSVRKTLELDAGGMEIRGQKWGEFMQSLEQFTKDAFLLDDDVTVKANLYKLLIYEQGGKFLKHKDTEKEPGMFGSMAIVLPSEFQGGDLKVEHGEEVRVFKASRLSTGVDTAMVYAWYTDLDHEITMVTGGHRVCLVYNLVASHQKRKTKKAASPRNLGPASSTLQPSKAASPPRAPAVLSRSDVGAALASRLRFWATMQPQSPTSQWKFLYLFDHQYSTFGRDTAGLKRKDKLVKGVLEQAVQNLACAHSTPIRMEEVPVSVSGTCPPGDGDTDPGSEIENQDFYVTSETLGRVELVGDSVLQPANLARLGKFSGGGHMGNYPGDFDQEYNGRGLLLYIDPRVAPKAARGLGPARLELDVSPENLQRLLANSMWSAPALKGHKGVAFDKTGVKGQAAPKRNGRDRWDAHIVGVVLNDRWTAVKLECSGARQNTWAITWKDKDKGEELAWTRPAKAGETFGALLAEQRLRNVIRTLRATGDIMAEEIKSALEGPADRTGKRQLVNSPPDGHNMEFLVAQLCEVLVSTDCPGEREKVHAKQKEINHWGNLALREEKWGDPLYEFIIELGESNLELLGKLESVLTYLVSEYERLTGGNSSLVQDYSQDARRVKDERLKSFLSNRSERELELPDLDKHERLLIHRQLNGIDVTHETVARRKTLGNLVIRKKNSIAQFASKKKEGDMEKLKTLRRLAEELGPAKKRKA